MVRRTRRKSVKWIISVLLLSAMPAVGAELTIATDVPGPNDGCGSPVTVALKGQIAKGDVDRLQQMLSGHLPAKQSDRHPGVTARLTLDSPGGNLLEGIRLANFVHDNAIRTHVGAGASCLSACSLVFMGGATVTPEGKLQSLRELSPGGRLGFHAPALPDDALDRIDADEFERLMVNAAREFLGLLREHNWAQSLVEASLSRTAPGEFVEIDTVDDAGRWRIGVTNKRRLRVMPGKSLLEYYGDDSRWLGNKAFCYNTERWVADRAATDVNGSMSDYAIELMNSRLPDLRTAIRAKNSRFARTSIDRYREFVLQYQPSDGYDITCHDSTDSEGRIDAAFWPGDGVENRSALPNIDNQGVALIPVDRIRAWHALPPDTPIARVEEAIAETGIFRTVGPEDDTAPFVVESKTSTWNHNGSRMELRQERLQSGTTHVTISYSQPKDTLIRLGFESGRLLFEGYSDSGVLSGRAHVFRRGCDPIAYGVTGSFDPKGSSFRLTGAAPDQSGDRCHPSGMTFDSSAANLLFDQQGISEYERTGQTQKVVLACPAAN
ncbi:hypothetical protein E3C22_09530 [Jiella endophytica]|uniref:Uncharacterized protein n=1 Tax=Jiella endophytica TaxID=2558362 RepID=A0A4Y8RRX1_9HYPH|nr:hypothetical protein [Jiella endophytica]TFF25574.1 hypothetical protein E3C22_09530 [Jiella endophytica]